MAERERIHLGAGVSLYREFQAWSIEVCRNSKRSRWSLATRDRGVAVMKAGNILGALQARAAAIEQATFTLATPLEFRDKFRKGYCPPFMVFEPELTALQNLALEGVRVEDIVKRAIEESKRPTVTSISPEGAIKEFETSLVRLKRNSIDFAAIKTSAVRKLIASARVPSLSGITAKHIEDWLSSFGEDAGQTLNKKLRYVSEFFKWCLKHKYVSENPAIGIDKSKTDPVDGSVYSKEELEAIFRKIQGRSMEKPVLLAFWTGLDRGDIEKLTGEELNLHARMITGRRNKTGKIREEVPIFDQALALVNTLPRKGKVFGKWKSMECVAGKANNVGIDFRKLRRSYVSHLISNGCSIVAVSRFAVHDPSTEAKSYAKPTGEPMIFTWHGKRLEPWGLPKVAKAIAR